MSDREQRIADALRNAPRQDPPTGLNRRIKEEIPEVIVPAGGRATRGWQGWLVAAALVVMVGAAWLAVRLMAPESGVPVTRIAEADLKPSSRQKDAVAEDFLAEEPAPEDATEPLNQSAASAEPARSSPEQRFEPSPEQKRAQRLDIESGAVASPPPAPAPASPPAETMRKEEPSREEAQTARRRNQTTAIGAVTAPAAADAVAKSSSAPAFRIEEREQDQQVDEDALELAIAPTADELGVHFSDGERRRSEFDELRDTIFGGSLPPPGSIDVEAVIHHFDYGDKPPWRRGRVSLFIEGGAAPFSSSRWRTVRVGIRSAPAESIITENAVLEIGFDPGGAQFYRRFGQREIHRTADEPSATIEIGRIPPDDSQTWLFEVSLSPEARLDQTVAMATLRFETPDGSEVVRDRSLDVGHISRTWNMTSSSLQLAAVAGTWAELLANPRSKINRIDLGQRAAALSDRKTDPEVLELTRLIEETVRLMNRPWR